MSEHESKIQIPDELRETFNRICVFDFQRPDAALESERVSSAAQDEARQERILLTQEKALTRGMERYLADVAGLLSGWKAAKLEFLQKLVPYREHMDAAEKLLQEIEEAEAKKDKVKEDVEKEAENNDTSYVNTKKAYEISKQKRDEYFEMHDRRNAKLPPFWIYAGLLLLVGLTEMAINYGAIYDYIGIPALAFGMAAGIGASIAYASHIHGTFLRQREAVFGRHVESAKKTTNWLTFGLGTTLFTVALGVLGWLRYAYFVSQLSGGASMPTGVGIETAASQAAEGTVITLGANVLVYLVGVAIAYFMHDPDPVYADAEKQYRQESAKYKKLHKALVRDKVDQRRAALEMDLRGKQNTLKNAFADAKELRDMEQQIFLRESRLVSEVSEYAERMLKEYHYTFVSTAQIDNPSISLFQGAERVPLEEYVRAAPVLDKDSISKMAELK